MDGHRISGFMGWVWGPGWLNIDILDRAGKRGQAEPQSEQRTDPQHGQ